jgi:hypothetical protein
MERCKHSSTVCPSPPWVHEQCAWQAPNGLWVLLLLLLIPCSCHHLHHAVNASSWVQVCASRVACCCGLHCCCGACCCGLSFVIALHLSCHGCCCHGLLLILELLLLLL